MRFIVFLLQVINTLVAAVSIVSCLVSRRSEMLARIIVGFIGIVALINAFALVGLL